MGYQVRVDPHRRARPGSRRGQGLQYHFTYWSQGAPDAALDRSGYRGTGRTVVQRPRRVRWLWDDRATASWGWPVPSLLSTGVARRATIRGIQLTFRQRVRGSGPWRLTQDRFPDADGENGPVRAQLQTVAPHQAPHPLRQYGGPWPARRWLIGGKGRASRRGVQLPTMGRKRRATVRTSKVETRATLQPINDIPFV